MPQGGGLLLQYDEIRQFNSCALCRAKGMTAGQLLGWNAGQSARRYNTSMPNSPLYTWSDMFDPYHNGDNLGNLTQSLACRWPGSLERIPASLSRLSKSLPATTTTETAPSQPKTKLPLRRVFQVLWVLCTRPGMTITRSFRTSPRQP